MLLHQRNNSKGNYNYNAYQYFNSHWAPHFHKNFELIYVHSGRLNLSLNGKFFCMEAGDYALILSNQIHSLYPAEPSSYWIAVFSEQYVPFFAKSAKNLQGNPIFRCSEEIHGMVLANLILQEGSLMMKKACFYAVCDQFMAQAELCERQGRADELIGRILDYIAENYRQPISLSTVAEIFGYEYHYLSRMLNKDYGIGFSHMVNEYRVDHALRLLEESDLSITEIAAESGFQSIRSFNHVFRSVTGHAPCEHVRNIRRRIEKDSSDMS